MLNPINDQVTQDAPSVRGAPRYTRLWTKGLAHNSHAPILTYECGGNRISVISFPRMMTLASGGHLAESFECTSGKDTRMMILTYHLALINRLLLASFVGSPSLGPIQSCRQTTIKSSVSCSSSATAIGKAFIKARRHTLRLKHRSRP